MKIKKLLPIIMVLLVLFTLPTMAAENTNSQTMTNVQLRFNAKADRVYPQQVNGTRVLGSVLAECKYTIDFTEDEYVFRFYNIVGELNVTSIAFYNTVGTSTAGFIVTGNELIDACEINVSLPNEGSTPVLEIRFTEDFIPSPGMPNTLAQQAWAAVHNHDVIAVSIQLTASELNATTDEWRVLDWYGTLNYDIWQTDYDRGYDDGYADGFEYGYDRGFEDGSADGGTGGGYTEAELEEARAEGYNKGKADGIIIGRNQQLETSLGSGIGDFLTATLGGFFRFELMPGLSIGGIFTAVVGCLALVWFLKMLAGG